METQTKRTTDVYTLVTNRIIKQLEEGNIPWRKPWGMAGSPQNLISKKFYRGINILLLSALGYQHNYFLSKKQVGELGAEVKEGEKPHMVVLWNWGEETIGSTEENTEKKKYPILRYYMVYNVAQCTGIPPERIPEPRVIPNPIEAMEEVINSMPSLPPIVHIHDEAFYNFAKDIINIPEMSKFEDSESYYSVLIHELVHSTGHETRLKRKGIIEKPAFGSPAYALEELIAEIGSCFLKVHTGIEKENVSRNSAGYIQGWLSLLRTDRKAVIYASSFAQKAVDYILNVNHPVDNEPTRVEEFGSQEAHEDHPKVTNGKSVSRKKK